MRRPLAVSTLLVLLLTSTLAPRAAEVPRERDERTHVYLVVVDGLGVDQFDRELMPHLFDETLDPVAIRGEGRAVMPTRTNPNHATLLTGLFPAGHGITGNVYWDRVAAGPAKLDAAALLEAETIFTVAEATRPELVTVAAFSKAKLGRMFDGVEGRQRPPDTLWVPGDAGIIGHLSGVAGDAETVDAFLALTTEREPDLAVVNLSEVDQVGHLSGPAATAPVRRSADAAIAKLVADLRARGRWGRSVLLVTADHGLTSVAATPERAEPSIVLSRRFEGAGLRGLQVAGDGGVAHVYAPATMDETARTLALGWAAALAWHEPGVAEVLARAPVPGVPVLESARSDWHLSHDRTGDLLVVARAGFQLVDPPDVVTMRFEGNHGAPSELRVPLVVAGGALDGRTVALESTPSSADVGATIASLLGLRPPRRFDGAPAATGTPLALPLRHSDPRRSLGSTFRARTVGSSSRRSAARCR